MPSGESNTHILMQLSVPLLIRIGSLRTSGFHSNPAECFRCVCLARGYQSQNQRLNTVNPMPWPHNFSKSNPTAGLNIQI